MSKFNKQDVAEHFAAERIVPTNEAEVPQRLFFHPWMIPRQRGEPCKCGQDIEYVPASALSEVWDAFQALFDMVNCALDSRDALLISKTSATMLKAEKLLAARGAVLSAGKESNG